MAYREMLPDDDWGVLQASFFAIYKIVASADGRIDTKEKAAFDEVISNAGKLKDSLAKEVAATIETADNLQRIFDLQKLPSKEILRKAAFVLDHKIDPRDAMTFKKHLIAIGVLIGNASGALFDYKLCHDEIDALREVGSILHISVKDMEQTNIILDIINTIQK